jgi:hypothetical protein
MPEKPILPHSVSYHLRASVDQLWAADSRERLTCPNYGDKCPAYSKLKK